MTSELSNSYRDAFSRLTTQSDILGRLAQDSGGFAAVIAAFESRDAKAFHWTLERLDLLPYCGLICDWVRTKLCVLRCMELCGPPREKPQTPNLQQFADAIVHLASNEKLLRRVVDAVCCGNAEDYRAALDEFKLNDFCYLLCHWVCSIVYRRVCEVVCTPQSVPRPDTVQEIRATGKVLARLIANKKVIEAIYKAAVTRDCEKLQSTINRGGFSSECEIICFLICSWRCTRVCLGLCVLPTPVYLSGVSEIEEARNFALAARQFARHPRALGDLVDVVQNQDTKAYSEIINRFGLGPYCHQVCAWVCSATCFEFCICVCPPPALQPWFTTVGYFDIYSDIDGTSGKTNKGLSISGLDYQGGPNFAFYGALQLGGFCPIYSPTSPGVAMKYRFLYAIGGGSLHPITGNLVSQVLAGTRIINWPQNVAGIAGAGMVSTFQSVMIVPAPPPLDPIPPVPGTTWVGPAAHYISPDPTSGWIDVDLNAIGGGFQTLLGFDTAQSLVAPGGPPSPGVSAGTAVPLANQRAGTDLTIIFEATRVTTVPPGTTADYSNSLTKIHINNWTEVNELWLLEFGTDCCTPIDTALSVQFTVDHEEMDSGAWSLAITSCSTSAPNDITPIVTSGGVTVTARGGSGTIVEDTSTWLPCSYTVTLTTRPGLTTGLRDRDGWVNPLTFCICGH